jgi:hypothetical protein
MKVTFYGDEIWCTAGNTLNKGLKRSLHPTLGREENWSHCVKLETYGKYTLVHINCKKPNFSIKCKSRHYVFIFGCMIPFFVANECNPVFSIDFDGLPEFGSYVLTFY